MKRRIGIHSALVVALSLIVLAAALRLLPHPANFAPVAAVSIFGGAVLPRRLAIWVPLGVMAVSDAVIGFYNIMPAVWLCYLLIALASSYWLTKPSLTKGVALTLGSSFFFFIVTNFAVWVAGGMYAHTWLGLEQCYVMALPFFRNTLLSDLWYTGALFAVFYAAQHLVQRHEKLGATV